jgi:hypothetical protein
LPQAKDVENNQMHFKQVAIEELLTKSLKGLESLSLGILRLLAPFNKKNSIPNVFERIVMGVSDRGQQEALETTSKGQENPPWMASCPA